MTIAELIALIDREAGSDLHLASGNPPTIRVDGELRALDAPPLTTDAVEALIQPLMSDAQRAAFDADNAVDFSLDYGAGARFRVNVFTNRLGAAAVLRVIPALNPTLDDIGAPPTVRRFAELERGLVLVTGPSGAGKSTTLAAMIHHINTTAERHILTIEDPIEFIHEPQRSLINQREVGRDTKTFAGALRSALREDPDVILVGEMRDHETIGLALTAAETGHLVLGTLHARSAAKSPDRIVDVFPAADKEMVRTMLAGSLEGVVAQALLKRAAGRGRVAAFEVLVGTNAVRNLIRENKVPQIYSMMQVGADYGMQTMPEAVEALVAGGAADADDAARLLAMAASRDDERGAEDGDGATPQRARRRVSETPDEYSF